MTGSKGDDDTGDSLSNKIMKSSSPLYCSLELAFNFCYGDVLVEIDQLFWTFDELLYGGTYCFVCELCSNLSKECGGTCDFVLYL